MKLEFENKEYEVEISVPTRTARKELRKLDKKKGERFDKLNKEYADVVAYYRADAEAKLKMVEENPGLTQKTFDYIEGVTEITEDTEIEGFKAICRKDKLEGEIDKLFRSEAGSDFWCNQNMAAIQEAVSSFRGVLREG